MKNPPQLITFFIAFFIWTVPLLATAQVSVEKPWSRPAQKGQNGAVFLQMKGQKDKLIRANCADCKQVELHTHITEKVTDEEGHTVEVKKMRPVPFIEVHEKGITELKRGGLHIMLLSLKRDLKPGDTVEVTLVFEKSAPVTIAATVKKCCGGCHSKEKKKA